MKTTLRMLAGCGLLLTLVGCVESEQPLSSASTAQQDPRLHGLWSHSDGGNTAYILIGAAEDPPSESGRPPVEPGMMRYWSLERNDETQKLAPPSGAQFWCTKVGDHDFGNWISPATKEEPAKPETYFFVKYRVEGDRLSIWLQDPGKTAAAIEAGKLQGTVKRRPANASFNPGGVESIRITDSSENIRKFLADGGAVSCYPEENRVTYQRVR